MKKADKMNFLYKTAFILMVVCVALLVAALVFSSLLDNITVGVVFAVIGVVLCVVAIILAMFSKPNKQKPTVVDEPYVLKHPLIDDDNSELELNRDFVVEDEE